MSKESSEVEREKKRDGERERREGEGELRSSSFCGFKAIERRTD